MAFIYVITNDINDKQYVGKTIGSIEQRFKEHIKDSYKDKYEQRPLYNAMRKYGVEHFHISQLEECSSKDCAAREIYWIGRLNTYKEGYNATLGGDGRFWRDYKTIAQKYLQLQNESKVADFFQCSRKTVRLACKEYNIPIKEAGVHAKENSGKKVLMKDTNGRKLCTFNDMSDAGRYLIEKGIAKGTPKTASTAISRVIQGKRKQAYGFLWESVN